MVERTQPADPLVLNSFQFVTNITATFSTTLVPSPSQLLLRGGNGVHQGPSEVAEGSVVPWATILEMLVKTSVVVDDLCISWLPVVIINFIVPWIVLVQLTLKVFPDQISVGCIPGMTGRV